MEDSIINQIIQEVKQASEMLTKYSEQAELDQFY